MRKVTAVFDIGKTNKKFFLLDQDFKEVYKSYKIFDPIVDEDGFESEDLKAVTTWAGHMLSEALESNKYKIKNVNFSTYGASLVHIDKEGKPVTPLYNYVKPISKEVVDHFTSKYGDISEDTASPDMNFLSSGLQLYWLKHFKPKIFSKIRYSLHFPQYMSYYFTGIPVSEYTSIGCHTMLWDHSANDYHSWVYKEEIDKVLPPIKTASTRHKVRLSGNKVKVGVGIHDSSAALIPYIRADKKPFLLVSTGTWSVSLNPFASAKNTSKLKYLRENGSPVAATKEFLGNEYKLQVSGLTKHFGLSEKAHKTTKFDQKTYEDLLIDYENRFRFRSIKRDKEPKQTDYTFFESLNVGYHQLMMELMEVQIQSTLKCLGNSRVNKIYIDGGFTDNDIFVKLLSYHFRNCKIRTTESPLGSALGAAIVISDKSIGKKFLKVNYNLKKHKALILQSN